MKKTFSLVAVGLLAAWTIIPAVAQPPAGTIALNVNTASNAVWDVSVVPELLHPEDTIEDDEDSVEIAFVNTPFVQTGTGKLMGSGTTFIDIDGGETSFQGRYTISGSVRRARGLVTRMLYTVRGSGIAFLEERNRRVSASFTYDVNIDAAANTTSGRSTAKASAAGLGTIIERDVIEPDVIPPAVGDGSWTLTLNLQPTNNRLRGTATVLLSSGTQYPFTVRGVYSPRTQKTSLTLTGRDLGRGASLRVTMMGNHIIAVTGRISGQSVSVR